jgi:hypothetical protein
MAGASGNGSRRDHVERRRTRDLRDGRRDEDRPIHERTMPSDWDDREAAPERRDEREWRGHEDRPRERRDVWDSAWDRRGDEMYVAGQSRRDQELDEGRFEQRRRGERGFGARDDYESGSSIGERGGRIAGGYLRNDGDLRGGYGRGQSGYGAGFGGTGYSRATGFYGRDRQTTSGSGYAHQGRFTEGSRYGGQDEDRPGGHRGKGPHGYTRSDDRIREDACEALTLDDHVDATGIHVAVRDGEVTLSGTVPERYMKRLAEDLVEDIAGVRDVQNQIRVLSPNPDRKG